MSEIKIPRPEMKIMVAVINTRKCENCGKVFKPKDNETVCDACTEFESVE